VTGHITISTNVLAPQIRELANESTQFCAADNYNPKYLPISSRDVLKRIAAGNET